MLRNRDLVPQRRGQQGLSPFGGSDDLFNPSSFFSGSPWQMMRRMQEDMDRLFGQVLGQGGALAPAVGGAQFSAWAPHVDVSETDQEFRIEADLPGVRQEDINIQVQDGMLILSAKMQQGQEAGQQAQGQQAQQGEEQQPQGADGQSSKGQNGQVQSSQAPQSQPIQYHQRERRYGYFERVMSLPPQVDEENIQADFRDGVLTLRLPKMQQIGQQGRRIQIGSGASGQQASSGQSKSDKKQMSAGAGVDDKQAQSG